MSLIGKHITSNRSINSIPKYAYKIGCNIFQFFVSDSTKYLYTINNKDNFIKLKKNLDKYDIKMVIHASYVINLCHPYDSHKKQASVKTLINTLNISEIIGQQCLGVVIHMGKNNKENNITDEQAMKNYVDGINYVINKTNNSVIILETGASQGNEIGSRLEDLAKIYYKLSSKSKNRIGICIDTCHIWASGYDISTIKGVKEFYNLFDKLIGINKISCIHFNNSTDLLNSHIDRHASLENGMININGLKYFFILANKYNIPIIFEFYCKDIKENEILFKQEKKLILSWV